MKALLAGLACCMIACPVRANAQEEGLTLPDWEQDEVQIFPLGGSLLPRATTDAPQGQGQERAAQDDLRALVPQSGVQGEGDGGRARGGEKLVEVDADFFERSEGLVSGGLVFDPGGYLEHGEREELSLLLSEHSQRSKIEAHLVVLGGKQQLPAKVDVSKVGGANLMEGLGCMVVYPLGEPWRVRLFMSRRVTQVVKPEYLRMLARACIQEAVKSADAEEQLQRFLNQLSIRLTWLEREHELPVVENAEGVAMPAVASVPTSTAGGGESGVTEVGMQAPVKREQAVWQVWWERLKPWVWRGLAGVALLAVLWMVGRGLWRKFRRQKKVVVWILPEAHVRPRLGGRHCGGGGASVKY